MTFASLNDNKSTKNTHTHMENFSLHTHIDMERFINIKSKAKNYVFLFYVSKVFRNKSSRQMITSNIIRALIHRRALIIWE